MRIIKVQFHFVLLHVFYFQPSTEEIFQFVKVQWQLSDLREINNQNGCLPPNLSQQKFITLSENYILQVHV